MDSSRLEQSSRATRVVVLRSLRYRLARVWGRGFGSCRSLHRRSSFRSLRSCKGSGIFSTIVQDCLPASAAAAARSDFGTRWSPYFVSQVPQRKRREKPSESLATRQEDASATLNGGRLHL